MFMFNKKIVLATVTAAIPIIILGCSNAGRIENPTIRFPGLELTLPSIEWGPAAELPEGSVYRCNAIINGHPVQLYRSPSGAPWFIDSDGDAHPVVEGDVDCPDEGGSSLTPEPADDSVNSISTHSISFEFDEDIDYASVSFTIPANKTFLYRDASLLPFLVNESAMQMINGDLFIVYSGTINDVLGALWWVGVGEIAFTDLNANPVNISWHPDMNIVTIDTSVRSEMIVMVPTNLSNWPLGND